MIDCDHYRDRVGEMPIDGGICVHPQAIAAHRTDRPSWGICETCSFRPKPLTDAQIAEVVTIARAARLPIAEVTNRIKIHLPICETCDSFDQLVRDSLVKCDDSKRSCGCVNIALENCPKKRFVNDANRP